MDGVTVLARGGLRLHPGSRFVLHRGFRHAFFHGSAWHLLLLVAVVVIVAVVLSSRGGRYGGRGGRGPWEGGPHGGRRSWPGRPRSDLGKDSSGRLDVDRDLEERSDPTRD
jgi:hypothetical protein